MHGHVHAYIWKVSCGSIGIYCNTTQNTQKYHFFTPTWYFRQKLLEDRGVFMGICLYLFPQFWYFLSNSTHPHRYPCALQGLVLFGAIKLNTLLGCAGIPPRSCIRLHLRVQFLPRLGVYWTRLEMGRAGWVMVLFSLEGAGDCALGKRDVWSNDEWLLFS
jgi:hypothetical protein